MRQLQDVEHKTVNQQDAGPWYIHGRVEREARKQVTVVTEYAEAWKVINRIKRIKDKRSRNRAWARAGELVNTIRKVLVQEHFQELAQ